MRDVLIVALIGAASLPYALAALLLAGDSPSKVLLWMALGVAYGCCLGEAADRLLKKAVR